MSSGTPSSNQTPPAASSLDLIKLEIRQLLAADNWKAAVERLDQAEAAAIEGRQFEQAFAFAKAAIGVLQKQSSSERNIPSLSVEWIRRALDRSVRYSNQSGADILHFAAVEASLVIDQVAYEGRLDEHLRNWPDADSSNDVRRRLAELTLLTGRIGERLNKLVGSPELLSPDELVNLRSLISLERFPKRYRPVASGVVDPVRDLDKRLSELELDGDPELQLAFNASRLLTTDFSHLPGKESYDFDFSKYLPNSPYAILGRLLQAAATNAVDGVSDKELGDLSAWFESDSIAKIGTLIQLDLALSEILQTHGLLTREKGATSVWNERVSRIHRDDHRRFIVDQEEYRSFNGCFA